MKIIKIVTGSFAENCYIVYDEQALEGVVIDPGDDAPRISEKLEELRINLKYILFTHGHFDHINAYFQLKEKYPDALSAASEKEAELLSDPSKSLLGMFGSKPAGIIPDILLSENDKICFGGSSLSVMETPGHTEGSICFYSKGVLFSGDTLFRLSMGRCDLPTGSLKDEVLSITQKLFKLPEDTIVYSGHGEDSDIKFEKENNEVYSWF